MDGALFSVMLIIIFSTLTVGIFLFSFLKRRNTVLKDLSLGLGAQKMPGGRYSGTLDGVDYTYHYYPGSKNSPSSFTIIVPCESKGELKIIKETAFDRFFKKLGVALEIQTHDKAFDDRFYIETEQPAFARAYLQMPQRREEIFKIFDQRFTSLQMTGQLLKLIKSPFSLEHELKDDFVASSVKSLIALSKDIPLEVPDGQSAMVRGRSYKAKSAALIGGAALALVFGLALTFWSAFAYLPLDVFRMSVFSLQYSVSAYGVFIFVSFSTLRGHARAHKDLMAVILLGIVAAGFSGYGIAAVYNGYMDASVASVHRTRVASKRYARGKNSTTYYLGVESWRPGRIKEEFSVPWALYNSVREGHSSVIVVTKPGKLGFEWKVMIRKDH